MNTPTTYRPTLFASGLNRPSNARPWILAGAPIGTVAGELSPRMVGELATYASRGGLVFVDSGAFPAFRKGTEVNFDAVVDTYLELANATDRPGNLHLVAPDVVGDQAATFELLAQYAGELSQLADLGVTLLVPIQRGELSILEAFDRTEAILPEAVLRTEWVVALPFNAHAWDTDSAVELASDRVVSRIHLLGGGVAKVAKVAGILGDPLEDEATEIQGDACRIVAWRGSYAVKGGRNHRASDRLVRGIEDFDSALDDVEAWDAWEAQDGDDWTALKRQAFEEALWRLACAEAGNPALAVAPWECLDSYQPPAAAAAPACLYCGEEETFEVLEVWVEERAFQVETCCEGAHAELCAWLEEADDATFREWFRLQTGIRPRRVFETDGAFRLDYGLRLGPVTLATAKSFVREHHRHRGPGQDEHRPPCSWRWGHGLYNGATLVGVAMVGRPVARRLDPTQVLEVNRLALDPNLPRELVEHGASKLYAAAAREGRRRGFSRIVTYVLASEAGTSVKAAGWELEATTRGGSWNRPSRPRRDSGPTDPKVRYGRRLRKGAAA